MISQERWQAIDDDVEKEVMQATRARYVAREAQARLDGPADEPLQLVSLGELRRRPPMEWLAEKVIARDTVAALSGPAGGGKSFIAVDLACSVATGLPFLGERSTRRGRVLYIAGEGIAGLAQRVDAWMVERAVTVDDAALTFIEAGVNLSSQASVDRLVEANRSSRFDLIIVDTFSTLSGVQSENDAAQVATVIRAVVAVRQASPGCAALIIHHTGKDADRGSRGSSAFTANVDTQWVLSEKDGLMKVSTESGAGGKMKDAERETIQGLYLAPAGTSAVIRTGGVTLHPGDPLAVLDPDQTYSTGDLLQRLELNRSTGEKAIRNFVESGRLEKVTRGVYRLTQSLADRMFGDD